MQLLGVALAKCLFVGLMSTVVATAVVNPITAWWSPVATVTSVVCQMAATWLAA
jgi:hypothetical protein